MQNKSIINNQWTSNKGQCHKYNDLVWQVGYFERLGRNPDQEPDILCMSLKNADKEFLDFVQTKFIKSISQKKFSEINSEDFKQWNNLLTIFPEILWAIDGHLFFATQQSSKEELYNKVQQVADKYQLKIVNNHMLM